mgnify:CR=1 FL=1
MELVTVFLILGATIFLFVTGKLRADLVALMSMVTLIVTGILDVQEALAGFSNSTVFMLAGLFIVSGGILRTGLAHKGGELLKRYSNNNETRLFILIILVVAIVGSFISNTGTVAILLPIVISLATSMDLSTSKFLIPLAFSANLSGLMTLISTPTNLIVSQTLTDYGFKKLGFFSVTPLGIIAFITGLIYMLLVRNVLLPENRKRQTFENKKTNPYGLIHQYHLQDKLHRVFVPENSPVVSKSLKDLKLPSKYHLIVLKIERKAGEGLLLRTNGKHEMAGPDSIIEPNDILYLQGSPLEIARFAVDFGLTVEPHKEEEQLVSKKIGVAEVLLTPNSSLVNQTVGGSGFREKYNLNIIGINRKGTYILEDIQDVRLRFGDALLVQGDWDDIEFLTKDTNDLVVVGKPAEYASYVNASGKAPVAAMILLFMVGLMIFDVFPTVVSVLIAAGLMILTGCLRNMDDAYSHINWESIILIGAMMPMGTALEKTGGMELITNWIIETVGSFGPIGVLAGIYLVTNIFGQFVSNSATAVLFAPIALKAALELSVSPLPFVMAVAVASGMSFATPFSSPTNALVMTAGNYTFSDFFKIGMPFIFIMFAVMMIAIPIIFPF